MQSYMKSFHWKDHIKFILPSLLGIFLFMTPIKTTDGLTIPIALLASWVEVTFKNQLSLIMMIIIVLTAILTIVMKLLGKERLKDKPFMQRLFLVNAFWVIVRILAAIFAIKIGRASCRERM